MKKAGVLVNAIDLEPSGKSKRLIFKNNDLRVLDGPFSESKELIGGFAVMELSGMDEAIAMSRRYAAILGGTLEMDIRPLAVDHAEPSRAVIVTRCRFLRRSSRWSCRSEARFWCR